MSSLFLGSNANAVIMTDTYTESFNFGSYNTLYDRNPGQDADGKNYLEQRINRKTVSFDRFDESKGRLIEVDIWFETDWSLTSTVNSYDTRTGYRTATGSGKSVSNQQIRLIDPWREIARNNEVVRSTCRDKPDCRESDSASGMFNGTFDLGSFSMSDFIGTDAIDFRVVRTLKADLTKCGFNDSCWQRNSNNGWGGDIHVAYTYDVPEPTTLALMSLGLAGIGASRLKKRS